MSGFKDEKHAMTYSKTLAAIAWRQKLVGLRHPIPPKIEKIENIY